MIRHRTALAVAAASLTLAGCGAGAPRPGPAESGSSAHGVDLTVEDFSTADELRADYTVHNEADEAMVITDRPEDGDQNPPEDYETYTVLESIESSTAIISKRLAESIGGDEAVFSTGRVIAPGDELSGTAIVDLPLAIGEASSGSATTANPTEEAVYVGDWRFCLGVIPLADLRGADAVPETGATVPVQQDDRAEQFTLCSDPEAMP